MNRILVIGAGSIGQRHIRALLNNGEKNIAAFRTNKGNLSINESLKNAITEFYDFDKALNWSPTHIIISNPTSMHYQSIIDVIGCYAKLFIEKPVIDNYDLLEKNKETYTRLINSEGLTGFNLRFHSLFSEIRNIIDNNTYGKPVSAYLHVGHYLPFWHPYEDYRTSYVARKDMGGGVLRTLTHELDLVQYFFGSYKKVFAKIGKLSHLEIDTDDTTDIIAVNQSCRRSLIHLDILDPVLRRFGCIYFDDGLLEYDFVSSKIWFTSYKEKEKKVIFDKKEDYDLQYRKQMDSFINKNPSIGCTIKEGLDIDKVVKYCRISDNKKMELCLD